MPVATVLGVHPVIPAKGMTETLAFYVDRLGFTKTFDDASRPGDPVTYAGISRDALTLHLQAMVPGQSDGMRLIRIQVPGIEALYQEYDGQGVVAESGTLRITRVGNQGVRRVRPKRSRPGVLPGSPMTYGADEGPWAFSC